MSTTLAEDKTESKITVELVNRVSRYVAKGIALRLAVAGEGVTQAEYEAELRRRPELAAIQDVMTRQFLEDALNMLMCAKNPRTNIR
jgi:hypothetical protein